MFKKIFCLTLLSFIVNHSFSQVLFSERFNNLILSPITYTVNNIAKTYLYADVPSTMLAINEGNLTADTLTGNYPFRTNGQKQKAWLSYVPTFDATDTFAVSTSWLKPTGSASAWLITPTISISANSALSWEAMTPDINNPDGYEVYVSTSTSASPVASDFSTQIFSINSEVTYWTARGLSLASFQGQTIRIGFKNNSSNKYQLWLDNIKVENVATQYDVAVLWHSVYKYSVISSSNTFSATVKNNGYSPVTNLNIQYKVGSNLTVSETKILLTPLQYLESRTIAFSTLYTSPVPAYNTFAIWTGAINGQPDANNTNDTVKGSITVSQSSPVKKVLLEQFTSATDGQSPKGQAMIQSIVSTNTNVIVASLHINDSVTVAPTATLQSLFNADNEVSTALIDRYLFESIATMNVKSVNWNSYITQRQLMKVPATVTVTNVSYNAATRQVSAVVSASFVGDVKGQYNLNLYVKENNIYGPIADSSDNMWNQHNGLYNIPSSQYYQSGNFDAASGGYIMSGVAYKHQNVINDMLDTWLGDGSVIPTNTTTIGQTYSKNYSFILPAAISGEFRYNADNIYLVGVLSESDASYYNGLSILNSDQQKLTSGPEALVGLQDLGKTDIQLSIFPNPATDICHLNYRLKNEEFVKVSVYNMMGELVYIETKNVSAGNVDHILNISNLQSGNYMVRISIENNSITKKLTIIK